MLKKNTPPLKKFHDCFLTHIKTTWLVVPLIILGNLDVFDRLQINPESILWCTNEVRSTRR